jgi:hypothetical protein
MSSSQQQSTQGLSSGSSNPIQFSSGGDIPMPSLDISSGSDLSDIEEPDPTVLPESSSYLYVAGLLSRELLPPEANKTMKMRITCLHPGCTKKWTVPRKMTTTSNYRRHYSRLHPQVALSEAKKLADAARAKDGGAALIAHTKENWAKMGRNGILRRRLKELLIDLIVKCGLSLRIVESPAFHRYQAFLDSAAPTFSHQTMARELRILFIHGRELLRQRLEKQIASGGFVSLTLDIWSSCVRQDFMGITVHFLDKTLRFESGLLDFIPLTQGHTGREQCGVLVEVLTEYNLLHRVLSVTTDNASCNDTLIRSFTAYQRNTTATPLSNGENPVLPVNFTPENGHVRCMAHILNLACQAILKSLHSEGSAVTEDYLFNDGDILRPGVRVTPLSSLSGYAAAMTKTRRIIAKFRNSSKLRKALSHIIEWKFSHLSSWTLILDCPTRWSSTSDMLDVFLTLWPAVKSVMDAASQSYRFTPLMLGAHEISMLHELLEVFGIFKVATLQVSGQTYPTISWILPFFVQVMQTLEGRAEQHGVDTELGEACSAAWRKMGHYYSDSDTRSYLATATILDPRYRFQVFDKLEWTFEEKNDAFERFAQQFQLYQDRYVQEVAARAQAQCQHPRPTTTQSAPKRRKLALVSDEQDVALLSTGLFYVEEEDDAPDAEISAYQNERPLARHANPLDFWRCNAARYPILSRMVYTPSVNSLCHGWLTITAGSCLGSRLSSNPRHECASRGRIFLCFPDNH